MLLQSNTTKVVFCLATPFSYCQSSQGNPVLQRAVQGIVGTASTAAAYTCWFSLGSSALNSWAGHLQKGDFSPLYPRSSHQSDSLSLQCFLQIVIYWFRSCLGVPERRFFLWTSDHKGAKEKNRIFRTPLCLARYLPCASALQPDTTCARLSCSFPHNPHLTSIVVSVPVLFWWYSFVGSIWLYSSKMPAIVCEGASLYLWSQLQLKQFTWSSSTHRSLKNFPCQCWSRIASRFSRTLFFLQSAIP